MAAQKMRKLIPDRTRYSSDTSSGGSIHGGGPVILPEKFPEISQLNIKFNFCSDLSQKVLLLSFLSLPYSQFQSEMESFLQYIIS